MNFFFRHSRLTLLLALFGAALFLSVPASVFAQVEVLEDEPVEDPAGVSVEAPAAQWDEFYRGVVSADPTEEMITEYGRTILRQTVPVELTSGPEAGEQLTLEFTLMAGSPGQLRLFQGDRVVVGKSVIDGEQIYYISDVYRLNALWLLFGVFLALVLVLARFAGVRALAGLFISFAVIIWFMVPRIIAGQNALLIAFVGTIGIATVSLFIAHGFRSRTTIAFVSTLITICLTLGLAVFFTDLMHLFGLGSEEAFFLQTAPEQTFNLRGILLAGIIIGTLGVLDDITTAQAAVVEELHLALPTLSIRELYTRGASVGREHIISLVNTLILAYTGAALPLILLFQIYERPAWLVLNSEIVMEEVVRMLIGSIALVLAVPLTTALAAWWYGRRSIGAEHARNILE